jgi:hypothetical protein
LWTAEKELIAMRALSSGMALLLASGLLGMGSASASASTSYIYTVAGTGQRGYTGDGGPATQAQVAGDCLAAFASGDLLLAGGGRVREIDDRGVIRTVAGTGRPGMSGDGGPATNARVSGCGMAVLANGGFALATGNRVRQVGPDGTIATIAGTGHEGWAGDGGPAVAAQLAQPSTLAASPDGGLFIELPINGSVSSVVRRVDPDGRISTFAGVPPYDCTKRTSSPARTMAFDQVDSLPVAPAPDGGAIFATVACVMRLAPDGTITTVAGTGEYGQTGDGGPAIAAQIKAEELAATGDGGFLIAGGGFVRRIDAAGTITTVAGCDGSACTQGDGPALTISFDETPAIAAAPDGSFYLATATRVAHVDSSGMLSTVARLGGSSLSPAADGSLLLSRDSETDDSGGTVVRIDPGGQTVTVAGGGRKNPAIGARATDIGLFPDTVRALSDGGFAVRDKSSDAILVVAPTGTITQELSAPGGDTLDEGFAPAPDGSFLAGISSSDPDLTHLERLSPAGAEVLAGGPAAPTIGALASSAAFFDMAALDDGGLLLATARRLLRVDAAGRIAAVLQLPGGLGTLFGGAEGDTVATIGFGVWHIRADGTRTRIARGGDRGFFGSVDGEPARDAHLIDTTNQELADYTFAPTAHSGVYVGEAGRVQWIAPPSTTRLAVAITRGSLALLARNRIAVRTTVPATLRLVIRGRGVRRRARTHVRSGLSIVRLPRRPPDGEYDVQVRAQGAQGAIAFTHHRFLFGSKLALPVARRLIRALHEGGIVGCQRFGAPRVDCVLSNGGCGGTECFENCQVVTLRLAHDGVIYRRYYAFRGSACKRTWRTMFSRSPRHWRYGRAEAPPL